MDLLEQHMIPAGMMFTQEWQRIVFDPDGNRIGRLDSHWYSNPDVFGELLNEEYPRVTSTGYRYQIRTRFVSEIRPLVIFPDGACNLA